MLRFELYRVAGVIAESRRATMKVVDPENES